MKASTEQTTFGAAAMAGVEEHLPQVLTERMLHPPKFMLIPRLSVILLASGGCTITIDITVPEDKVSWYDLWAAAVALDGMCARGRKTGQARFLGKLRSIRSCFVTIVSTYTHYYL